MTVTPKDYNEISKGVYDDKSYTKKNTEGEPNKLNKHPVTSSTHDASNEVEGGFYDYEQNGLQASMVDAGNGEKVIAFRGTKAGDGDVGQDLGLNDSNAYQSEEAQFQDAKAYVDYLISSGQVSERDIMDGKVTFTGHSLGGALASYVAIEYGGQATVYSAPSCYNWLTPEQKKKAKNTQITNYVRADDAIINLPFGVPRIGNTKYVKGNGKKNFFFTLFGAGGHTIEGFAFSADENPVLETNPKVIISGLAANGKSILGKAGLTGFNVEHPNISAILGFGVGLVGLGFENAIHFGGFIVDGFKKVGSTVISFFTGEKASAASTVLDDAAETIAMTYGFLGSQELLLNTIPLLENMRQINEDLLSKMQSSFRNNLELAAAISQLPYSEVEQIANNKGFDPESNIDLGEVEQATNSINQKIEAMTENANNLETVYYDTNQKDITIAQNFG